MSTESESTPETAADTGTETTDLLCANGIDADGNYLLPPIPADVIAKLAQGETIDPDTFDTLKLKHEAAAVEAFGVLGDETSIAESGWGILFAADDAAHVDAWKEALSPLLTLRREQAGERYYELTGKNAYRPGERKDAYLKRFGLGPGPVDPAKLPYYLLIVGDPRTIPFRFQYLMDVQFAIGRLHFDGTDRERLDALARYAQAVVDAEKRLDAGALHEKPSAAFVGVRNPRDVATALSSADLVSPLADEIAGDVAGWTITKHLHANARKADLQRLLGGADTPSLLFTASHGFGAIAGPGGQLDDGQIAQQGALVCSDWNGPKTKVLPEQMFAATDLADDARVANMIAFHFACFGAGTPTTDDFSAQAQRTPIAPYDFVARLPQRLLSHPGGPALAVVGHIDRAWSYSFSWGLAGAQRTVFRKALGRLMSGWPIGAAMEDFNARYAEISTLLANELEDIKFGAAVDTKQLAGYWTANSDARNYVLLGDPAVRLVPLA